MNMPMGGMAAPAQQTQGMGRGDDSMLVHMTPHEVNSLQGLAHHFGGALSTNPNTGLPEAGWLGKLLPTIIGAGLAATGIGAPLAAGIVMAGDTAITGSLKKGLMAGLGAYGGAGLAGMAGLGQAATGALPSAAGGVAPTATPGAISMGPGAHLAGLASTPAAGFAPGMVSAAPAAAGAAATGAGAGATGIKGALQGFTAGAQKGLTAGSTLAKAAPYVAGAGVLSTAMGLAPKGKKEEAPEEKSKYAGPYTQAPRKATPTAGAPAPAPITDPGAGGALKMAELGVMQPVPLPFQPGRAPLDSSEKMYFDNVNPGVVASPEGLAKMNAQNAAIDAKTKGKKKSTGSFTDPLWNTFAAGGDVGGGKGGQSQPSYGGGTGGAPAGGGGKGGGGGGGFGSQSASPDYAKNYMNDLNQQQSALGRQPYQPAGEGMFGGGQQSMDQAYGGFLNQAQVQQGQTATQAAGALGGQGIPSPEGQFAKMQAMRDQMQGGMGQPPGGGKGGRGAPPGAMVQRARPQDMVGALSGISGGQRDDMQAMQDKAFAAQQAYGGMPQGGPALPGGSQSGDQSQAMQGLQAMLQGQGGESQGVAPTQVEQTAPDPRYAAYSGYQFAEGGGLPGLAPRKKRKSNGVVNMESGGHVIPAFDVATYGNGSTNAGQKKLAKLGGKPVRGKGDGASDDIPAKIDGQHKARVADGEVYFPPKAVQKLGGNAKLYAMMRRAQAARRATPSGERVRGLA